MATAAARLAVIREPTITETLAYRLSDTKFINPKKELGGASFSQHPTPGPSTWVCEGRILGLLTTVWSEPHPQTSQLLVRMMSLCLRVLLSAWRGKCEGGTGRKGTCGSTLAYKTQQLHFRNFVSLWLNH